MEDGPFKSVQERTQLFWCYCICDVLTAASQMQKPSKYLKIKQIKFRGWFLTSSEQQSRSHS